MKNVLAAVVTSMFVVSAFANAPAAPAKKEEAKPAAAPAKKDEKKEAPKK